LLASQTTDAFGMTKALCPLKQNFLIFKPRSIYGLWMAHANGVLATIGFTTSRRKMVIDYARPCMNAEKALKDAHWAALDNKPDLVIALTLEALIEVSKMHAALVHQVETQVK
jgi:hypothetical protein